MVTLDSTGFGANEISQPLPGVQHGQRLTLPGLDGRLSRVEKVLRQLVQDFYDGGNLPQTVVTNTTNVQTSPDQSDLERENDALRRRIQELEDEIASVQDELDDAREDNTRLAREYEEVSDRLSDILDMARR